jgi:CrcB protein
MSVASPRLITVVGLVAVGGAAGALLRYGVNQFFLSRGEGWPLATFTVNIAGCLIMGLFLGRVDMLERIPPHVTPLMTTGFLGGLTTFSTFAAELNLIAASAPLPAAAYAVASVGLGVLAVRGGWWFAHRGAAA